MIHFVVQLPPVLPCSYSGYFIQYLYYAQLFVTISKHVNRTKCRVPFYVLPISSTNDNLNNSNNKLLTIPNLLTPMNLQERMSIFRKRKKSHDSHGHNHTNINHQHPRLSLQSASSSTSISSYQSYTASPKVIDNKEIVDNKDKDTIYKPSPSLLLPASDSHFIENNILSTTHSQLEKLEEKDNVSSYLFNNISNHNRDSANNLNSDDMSHGSLTHRDNTSNNSISSMIRTSKISDTNNKFEISLDNKSIGCLLLNDTIFCDGECIEGYLSLYTPAIVKVTLVHIEKCGNDKQKHLTNCCSSYQCCWDSPSFTFTLKIPNNAFKSFKSDLCQSSWTLYFEFAISKYLLSNKSVIQSNDNHELKKQDEMGYLNTSYDVWKLHEENNSNNNTNDDDKQDIKQVDKILKWKLPITVTTVHNPLRCVTRSNAVVVKC